MPSSGVGPTTQRLGRYHLTEPIGGGPTGEVFRAKVYGVAGFERQFAVKRFHPEFVKDPSTADAIAAAARVYGGLEHPRIARLHEYGVTGGQAFTATELIDGLDLARLMSLLSVRGRSLPTGAVAALVSQIARTVGYAHGRGICHLGLCPTNIIVTADGEARITDFGFLPPRLPARPADDPSLRTRLPYLAPEQLVSELTSAATDVFQMGAIAHELFTGRPAFVAPSSSAIAERILSGAIPPSDLPAPLAKVLARCLARSPFERYPDARALADAMDAATRGLALAGSLSDVGQAVREATDTGHALDDNEMSGALSFPLPAPPRGESMMDHLQLDEDLPATTVRDPRVLGLGEPAEPPLPVGVKAARPASAPTMPTLPRPSSRRGQEVNTLEGAVEELDEEMPTMIRERHKGFVRPTPLGLATVDKDGTPIGDDEDMDIDMDEGDDADDGAATSVASPPESAPAPSAPPVQRIDTPSPMSLAGQPASLLDDVVELSGSQLILMEPSSPSLSTSGSGPSVPTDDASSATSSDTPGGEQTSDAGAGRPGRLPETLSELSEQGVSIEPPLTPVPQIAPSGSAELIDLSAGAGAVPTRSRAPRMSAPSAAQRTRAGEPTNRPGPRKGLVPALLALLVLVLGGAGYLGYTKFMGGKRSTTAAGSPDAGIAGTVPHTSSEASGDGGARVAHVETDAGAEPDANTAAADDGKLTIRSTPERASIYLDGSLMGVTPFTIDATADRHRLALIRPGYKLHSADVDGSGAIEVTLQEAAAIDGPGGVKVRCSKKNRYYIIIDGADTGQLCPSERIGVPLGAHTVEIYDPVTESRREFPIDVKDTRHSLRLRVD